MPKQQRLTREQILDPAGRLRQLSGHGSAVPVDPAIPVKRYFRSGSEMERQARGRGGGEGGLGVRVWGGVIRIQEQLLVLGCVVQVKGLKLGVW